MRIASLFALHFDFYKLPQPFHLIHANDQVPMGVLDSPVLDMRQFNQAISAKRLFDSACRVPPGQKSGEQGIHLFRLARFWHQREGTLRTLNMCWRCLLIELEFKLQMISHTHKNCLTQQVKPWRIVIGVRVPQATRELHRRELFLELRP